MTETIAPPLMNSVFGVSRHSSIGRPVLTARLAIRDDDGRVVGPDEVGELVVAGERGVSLMQEYLDDPEATDMVIKDGWLRTGDKVRMDAEGFFYFVDRAKDIVKRAGENVALNEVERVMGEYPGVLEAAAIGVTDEVLDARIHAFVVMRDGHKATSEQIRDWCRQHLAAFKVPDSVSFMLVLPRTAVGKIQKRSLVAPREQEGTS